jgi:hypothetical protein
MFMRYWWFIRPFVGHLMRATVATIARDARPDTACDVDRAFLFG